MFSHQLSSTLRNSSVTSWLGLGNTFTWLVMEIKNTILVPVQTETHFSRHLYSAYAVALTTTRGRMLFKYIVLFHE